jgi:hypothetical protein
MITRIVAGNLIEIANAEKRGLSRRVQPMSVAVKSKPPRAARAAIVKAPQPQTSKFSWRDLPLHTINDASMILCGSKSRTYALLAEGKLEAARLAGKTLIKTASIIALMEKEEKAEQWSPDRKRVEKAVSARPDVIRKRAKAATT